MNEKLLCGRPGAPVLRLDHPFELYMLLHYSSSHCVPNWLLTEGLQVRVLPEELIVLYDTSLGGNQSSATGALIDLAN